MNKLFSVGINVALSLEEGTGINRHGFILLAPKEFEHWLLPFSTISALR